MRQRRWIELFSDYEYEIRYHPGKANVSEAFKEENVPAERLHGLDQQMERKEGESLYFMDRIWVPLVGGVRTIIMDEAHKTRYYVHPGADKMYYDLRDMYWWLGIKRDIAIMKKLARLYTDEIVPWHGVHVSIISDRDGQFTSSPVLWAEIGESRLIGPELVQETTDKVVLIKEKLKAARDHQKSYADNRQKPLEFEEPVEIMDREVKSLKRSKILIVKVCLDSKPGPEFTWEREDHMKARYPQLFVDRAVKPTS
ncbi:putative reverse transcriptase domain-containing protein [Tanacetum coccineum]